MHEHTDDPHSGGSVSHVYHWPVVRLKLRDSMWVSRLMLQLIKWSEWWISFPLSSSAFRKNLLHSFNYTDLEFKPRAFPQTSFILSNRVVSLTLNPGHCHPKPSKHLPRLFFLIAHSVSSLSGEKSEVRGGVCSTSQCLFLWGCAKGKPSWVQHRETGVPW